MDEKFSRQLITVTFHFPRTLRLAVARSLGREDPTATVMEVEDYIREVVKANADALLEEFCPPPRMSMRVKVKKRIRA